ncbi:MAG TPA: twin-arginine translocation signal domain-containing protein [Acidimicrobiales bacterium]|nr:twin-arginine translocation signal domain-containing protein [Acidimicrobiales bacterium]
MSDQTGDEATAEAAGLGDHSLDRRSLIKKVGIAGAAAWVAPVVIESLVSPAAAASIPPGTYRLRLSSEKCNPTPLLDPDAVPPPANCSPLASDFPVTDFAITTQTQLDAFDIVVSNCNRRYAIQLTTTNPKVTFLEAGSTSGNPRLQGRCVVPALTPTQVTWSDVGATDRNGYFIILQVAP